MGAFAVTAGIGIEEHVKRFEQDNDDYSAIMLKALADRLAEAFAERMHELVRKQYWGYAAHEALSNQEIIAEEYRGIRPHRVILPAPIIPKKTLFGRCCNRISILV